MRLLRILAVLFPALLAGAQQAYVPPLPARMEEAHPGSVPFPSQRLRWTRTRSQHFDVISSASPKKTASIVSGLETMAVLLTRTSPRFRTAATPTTIFVLSSRAESRAWFEFLLGPGTRLSGAYARYGDGGTMIIDAANALRIERTALHELVHDLLRQGDVVPPLWLEEGMAEYFGAARVFDDRILAGNAIAQHTAALRRARQPVSMNRIMAVKPESRESTAPLFYAQSWAAVDWLMQLDRTALYLFLEDLERGEPVETALASRYGKSVAQLEAAIRRRSRGMGSTVVFPLAKSAGPPAVVVLDRATVLYEMGQFLARVPGGRAEAQRYYEGALAIEPSHPRALFALGRPAEAVAAGPDDPLVHLMAAESLLAPPSGEVMSIQKLRPGDEQRFREARALAEKAVALLAAGDPLEGRALGVLGTTYLAEEDGDPGIAHLERALLLLPRRQDLALNLYALLLRRGERAKAEALWVSRFASASDVQGARAARAIFIHAEVDRANELLGAGELDTAAALLCALAQLSGDERTRRELDDEARKLERAAAVGRQIRMYNDAVALANTQRANAAVALLDELLRTATDPQVLRSAARLRDQVRQR